MEQKYCCNHLLKEWKAVKSMTDHTEMKTYELCQRYNDSGIDKIIIFDLSQEEEEHERIFEQSKLSIATLISKYVRVKILIVLRILRNYFMQAVCK